MRLAITLDTTPLCKLQRKPQHRVQRMEMKDERRDALSLSSLLFVRSSYRRASAR